MKMLHWMMGGVAAIGGFAVLRMVTTKKFPKQGQVVNVDVSSLLGLTQVGSKEEAALAADKAKGGIVSVLITSQPDTVLADGSVLHDTGLGGLYQSSAGIPIQVGFKSTDIKN